MHAGSTEASPRPSPPTTAVHSPPLTPAATKSRDSKPFFNQQQPPRSVPDVMTPQRSASPQRAPTSVPVSEQPGGIPAHPKHGPQFSIGPSGDSEPPSSDVSPSTTAPGTPAMQPSHHLRQQSTTEQRFRFGNRDPAQGFTSSGTVPGTMPPTVSGLPRSIGTMGSATTLNESKSESKRSSFFGGSKKTRRRRKARELKIQPQTLLQDWRIQAQQGEREGKGGKAQVRVGRWYEDAAC